MCFCGGHTVLCELHLPRKLVEWLEHSKNASSISKITLAAGPLYIYIYMYNYMNLNTYVYIYMHIYIYICNHKEISLNGGTPKWIVYNGKLNG